MRLAAPWLPPFLREVFGVQHVKAAVFDDAVLLTGANLSRDYFTTRQDRYLLVEDNEYKPKDAKDLPETLEIPMYDLS